MPRKRYEELRRTPAGLREVPRWFSEAVRQGWPDLDLRGRTLRDMVVVRGPSRYGYGRASFELNLGCNYDCKHCYLGLKEFAGMPWPDRERVLDIMSEAGVLWLQLTGGEPMIDRQFAHVYTRAFDLGMMLEVLTNGSRLHNPLMLNLLTTRRPHRITVSVYGASEGTYDGLTQRRGAFKAFTRGLAAAHEAGLPLDLSVIITKDNAHEADAMRDIAVRHGTDWRTYHNISPTIYGGAETLATQSPGHLGPRTPFAGCDAGRTFFHVDPHGNASMCKVGREPSIPLLDEGVEGLARLAGIADHLLQRRGGCTGCTLSGTCGTCMPLVTLYRKAKAPLANYCQHTEERKNRHGTDTRTNRCARTEG